MITAVDGGVAQALKVVRAASTVAGAAAVGWACVHAGQVGTCIASRNGKSYLSLRDPCRWGFDRQRWELTGWEAFSTAVQVYDVQQWGRHLRCDEPCQVEIYLSICRI